MILSKSCEYAIRASLLIANKRITDKREYVPVKELSEELKISFHFLTKILQKLTEAKIMTSYRGPKGGVGLALAPDKIYLIDIINAVESTNIFDKCLLGLPDCDDDNPCPMHELWSKKREQLLNMFEKETLSHLLLNREKFNRV